MIIKADLSEENALCSNQMTQAFGSINANFPPVVCKVVITANQKHALLGSPFRPTDDHEYVRKMNCLTAGKYARLFLDFLFYLSSFYLSALLSNLLLSICPLIGKNFRPFGIYLIYYFWVSIFNAGVQTEWPELRERWLEQQWRPIRAIGLK